MGTCELHGVSSGIRPTDGGGTGPPSPGTGVSAGSGALTSNFSDIESLADEIEAIAPDSRLLRPVVSLGSGFRSTVLQDAGGTVYLLGRTASVAKGYRYEVALLPTIREYLPCAVPDPHVVSGPTEGFPGGILAYPGLGGCPMRWSDAGAAPTAVSNSPGTWDGSWLHSHRVPQKALAGLEKRPVTHKSPGT